MRSILPSTPAEVLDISTPALRFTLSPVLKSARLFGFWDHPFKKAAASLEEMTLPDLYYWVHKCTNPITRMEKGERAADLLMTDRTVVGLPLGFEKRGAITLGAGGDLLRSKGLDHSKDVLFEKVADLLFDQTVSYANFESPITGQPLQDEVIGDRGPPVECCSREQFGILKGHRDRNFTVLHTANNHMFDMGVEGVETTQKVFADEGIVDVGTNRAPDEYGTAKILDREGIRLGFASASFGLNGHVPPENEAYRIHVARLCSKIVEPELDLLKRQIDDAKARGCDFIIASLHWGYEFEFLPRRRQVEIAHTLVEWGADAILAHHPHVIQPIEYYRTRRDRDRVAVIAYSLGSLTWGFTAPHLVLSTILNLKLSKGLFQGKDRTYIEEASATPVFRSYTENDGKTRARIEKLADHLDGRSDAHPPGYIAEIKRYADLVLGDTDSSDEQLRAA